jgi:SAM-dependent methyltransferase
MHQSAMFYGKKFFETYCSGELATNFKIVEIGSQDVNGSLREVAPSGVEYIGLDFVNGRGVDVVIDDPYQLPLAEATADIVVTSSCFEHSEFFWLVYLEAIRILKPGGLLYLNVPSNGFFHRWPVDCWRFYPDSGVALVRWAARNKLDTKLLESFIGKKSAGQISEGGMWNDFVAVILKDSTYSNLYQHRIINSIDEFENARTSDSDSVLNPNELGSDFSYIKNLQDCVSKLQDEIAQSQRLRGK